MNNYLLEVDDLHVAFPVRGGSVFGRRRHEVHAVNGVSLRMRQGDVLGLVGESGCGKSTLARAILRLVQPTAGRVLLDGARIDNLPEHSLRLLRPEMQLIFQDPYASLNPRMTVFDAIAEPLTAHKRVGGRRVESHVAALMKQVGLAPRTMRKYPHEFSGGQRQRIAIARALALKPRLVIADEPVSALDVSVQAQILNLIGRLCRDENLTLIFISHDLAVVRHIADFIAVMYLGRIVEYGPAQQVFEQPLHPYTKALLSAVPVPDPEAERCRRAARSKIEGDSPSPFNPPDGCAFHPRCPIAAPECTDAPPPLVAKMGGHDVACYKVEDVPRVESA